jgi:DNA (cytosine-5)-methyltransferase 1
MKFISLFAGIGGMDLGLERAGMECAAQVEIDDYASKVLAKHWPDVIRFRDVRDVGSHNLPHADLICGGFPCQDISVAATAHGGKMLGLKGERSGLWTEFYRIICELLPRWVVVENSPALVNNGLSTILHNFAEGGYDAEWSTISAYCVGAIHKRERLFIVAERRIMFADEMRRCGDCEEPFCDKCSDHFGDCDCPGPDNWAEILSDAHGEGLQGDVCGILAQPDSWRQDAATARSNWGNTAPRICGKPHGIPNRMDRLKGLGNAVVPQVAEFIGRRILEHEGVDKITT